MSDPCVLVLAGLDPSGGAGLLADADAIREAGARPLCVATALTVQTTRRALRCEPVRVALVLETARALLEEEDVRAVKLGMLGSAELARALAPVLETLRVPVVLDPVLAASSGAALYEGPLAALAALFRFCALVTPNAPEAQALLGLDAPPHDARALESAARSLLALGARAALVKGGHAAGPEAVDVLASAEGAFHLSSERVPVRARGTGCRLASSIAASLAQGVALHDAVRSGKAHVLQYLAAHLQM